MDTSKSTTVASWSKTYLGEVHTYMSLFMGHYVSHHHLTMSMMGCEPLFFFLFFFFFFFFSCFWLFFFFLNFFYIYKKKIQKHLKFSKRQKYFILCLVLFFLRITWIMISLSWFRTCLTLWRNLNSMCYISAMLFLIWCEYVLVCTYTQGLIKKLIFLVCVLSIT